ncbi:MAG: TRAP transporter large permease subunit, partial [Deltaproteobacteria bacterium]|nr:TRAP transporter large permease subunit [Deltaproteobacteria bacterium]
MADKRSALSEREERGTAEPGLGATMDKQMTMAEKCSSVLDATENALNKVIDPISTYLVYICAFFAMAMALIVVADVLLRVAFNHPLVGVIELETFMLAIVCFLSLAYTLIQGGHVSVDIFVSRFPEKLRLFLGSLFPIFGIYISVILSWQHIVRAKNAMHVGETSDLLLWPMWPFFVLVSFGFALFGFVLIINLLRNHARLMRAYGNPWWVTLAVAVVGSGIVFSPSLLNMVSFTAEPAIVGLFMMLFMLLLLFLGFPVTLTMALVGILGTWYLAGLDTCMGVIRMAVYDSVADYFFCVVPFFILMGFLCLKAGIGKDLYETGHKWFGQMPGGLAIGTIVGCGGFASICGDSMATAATMGSVSLPEMKKYKYHDSLATGSVAAGGTLGILIPPSLGFIVYAIVTEESVGKLFMAGFIPGILLTALFAVSVYIRCKLNPSLGPKAPKSSFKEKLISIRNVWKVVILFGLVIGGIYMGFFTPTEAGGVGVIGAFLIALTA